MNIDKTNKWLLRVLRAISIIVFSIIVLPLIVLSGLILNDFLHERVAVDFRIDSICVEHVVIDSICIGYVVIDSKIEHIVIPDTILDKYNNYMIKYYISPVNYRLPHNLFESTVTPGTDKGCVDRVLSASIESEDHHVLNDKIITDFDSVAQWYGYLDNNSKNRVSLIQYTDVDTICNILNNKKTLLGAEFEALLSFPKSMPLPKYLVIQTENGIMTYEVWDTTEKASHIMRIEGFY